MKPDQYMAALDMRLYNIQQQLNLLLKANNVTLPPDLLVNPPGVGAPTPEAAAAAAQLVAGANMHNETDAAQAAPAPPTMANPAEVKQAHERPMKEWAMPTHIEGVLEEITASPASVQNKTAAWALLLRSGGNRAA